MGPCSGFLVPILKVPDKFPKQVYQDKALYPPVVIGRHVDKEESLDASRIAAA